MKVDNIEDKGANDCILCFSCQDSTFEKSGYCLKCQRDMLRDICQIAVVAHARVETCDMPVWLENMENALEKFQMDDSI